MKFKIMAMIALTALSAQNYASFQMLTEFQKREHSAILDAERTDFEDIMHKRFQDYNKMIAAFKQSRRPLIAFNSVIENPVGKQELHVHLPDGTSLLMDAAGRPAIANRPNIFQRITGLIKRKRDRDNGDNAIE